MADLLPSGPEKVPDGNVLLPLRRRLSRTIEAAIALLDELDGDPDLEDGHDAEAPAIEWPGRGVHFLAGGCR